MNWKLIPKDPSSQPASGEYGDWKEIIAAQCFYQCVYCSIHEAQFGGIDHYHIDHFRPKSIADFKHLENDICNLFYACPICNRFKSNDWPGEPNLDNATYPDPCKTDYSNLFDFANYKIKGKFIAANYIIERLFLNRSQLIMERRETTLRTKANDLINEILSLMEQVGNTEIKFAFEVLKEIDSVKNNLLGLEEHRRKIRPYVLSEIRKP